MHKTIRIAVKGVAQDYRTSLVPQIIQSLGYLIEWVHPSRADLLIVGPFTQPRKKQRWLPKPLRATFDALAETLRSRGQPLTLFQTGENLRHDHVKADYSLSFDLAVEDPTHRRLPYWMEMVDWRHEGINGNLNPRFGKLLDLNRLALPLGTAFLQKPRSAAVFASHLREPRATLLQAVERVIPIHGFGPVFDKKITHHSESNFTKVDVLRDFAFNLCPENGMYPGYYTEKIPEAFMADSLPIAWVDSNVISDFNPEAFVNLAPMMFNEFSDLVATLQSPVQLAAYADQPLFLKIPSIERHKIFIKEIIAQAIS